MKITRRPEYKESLKTIKRSIQARGGIADEKRVLESLVWNYYKHLPNDIRRELQLEAPRAWDASAWVAFRTKLLINTKLITLVIEAKANVESAIEMKELTRITIYNAKNEPTTMLVLPGTKVQLA